MISNVPNLSFNERDGMIIGILASAVIHLALFLFVEISTASQQTDHLNEINGKAVSCHKET